MLFCLINDSLDDLTATTASERAEMLASVDRDEILAEDLENGEIGADVPEWTEANFASLVATLWI
jgi:hypothetical protein